MAVKSADQITIIDVTDAYSIMLSSEAFVFDGDASGAPAGLSCTTQAEALCGSTRCTTVTVNQADIVCPTGISATVSNNGTQRPTITFTTTAKISAACEATIPVSVDGIVVNKKFSFGVAKTGPAGATGESGADGKGVKSTAITYQAASSGTNIPTGTWSSTIPTVSAGQYLWTRTVITYTDNTTSTSYSVGMMGATGETGATGEAGKGVKSTVITYQASTSGTTAPTGTWSSTIPSVAASQYLWTRTVITYTDNTTSTSYSVGMIGATGEKGDTGETGAAGADAILISISASPAQFFKNSSGTITLTAHVFVGGLERTVTDAGVCTGYGTIKWYKGSDTTAAATSRTLVVTASEVTNSLAITAQLE